MKQPLSRRHLLQAGGAAAMTGSGFLVSGQAHAQSQTLRLGHVLAPAHPFHQGLELAAKKLAEASNGRFKLQVFPSSQLGTERDMHIAIRTGGVDMLLGSPGGASVHVKELAILDAPYLFRNNAHWQSVVYGPVGEEWQRKAVANAKVHIMGWFHRGTRHVISRTKSYDTLGAMANQKIRVADLPPYPQVFRALGAVPTPIAKYINLVSWSFAAPGPILLSDAASAQLGTDGQRLLAAALREGSAFVTDAFTNGEEAMKKQAVSQGMVLNTPTDLPAWRAAGAKAIPDLASTWGGDVALYARIRDHAA